MWLQRSVLGLMTKGKQLLSCELVAVLIGEEKIPGNISEAICFAKEMESAIMFLVEQQCWYVEQFEEVNWRSLHRTLKSKPYGYKI